MGLGANSEKFHQASGDVPILNVEVSIFIPEGSVCAAESTFDPLILGDIVVSTFCWIWVVAEDGDDGVAFIEDDESAIEVGYGDEITLDCDGGGHS